MRWFPWGSSTTEYYNNHVLNIAYQTPTESKVLSFSRTAMEPNSPEAYIKIGVCRFRRKVLRLPKKKKKATSCYTRNCCIQQEIWCIYQDTRFHLQKKKKKIHEICFLIGFPPTYVRTSVGAAKYVSLNSSRIQPPYLE